MQVADVILLTCGVLYFSQAVPLALQGHALLRTLPPGNGMLGHAHQGWDAWKGRRLALALRLRGGASATVCDGREHPQLRRPLGAHAPCPTIPRCLLREAAAVSCRRRCSC